MKKPIQRVGNTYVLFTGDNVIKLLKEDERGLESAKSLNFVITEYSVIDLERTIGEIMNFWFVKNNKTKPIVIYVDNSYDASFIKNKVKNMIAKQIAVDKVARIKMIGANFKEGIRKSTRISRTGKKQFKFKPLNYEDHMPPSNYFEKNPWVLFPETELRVPIIGIIGRNLNVNEVINKSKEELINSFYFNKNDIVEFVNFEMETTTLFSRTNKDKKIEAETRKQEILDKYRHEVETELERLNIKANTDYRKLNSILKIKMKLIYFQYLDDIHNIDEEIINNHKYLYTTEQIENRPFLDIIYHRFTAAYDKYANDVTEIQIKKGIDVSEEEMLDTLRENNDYDFSIPQIASFIIIKRDINTKIPFALVGCTDTYSIIISLLFRLTQKLLTTQELITILDLLTRQ